MIVNQFPVALRKGLCLYALIPSFMGLACLFTLNSGCSEGNSTDDEPEIVAKIELDRISVLVVGNEKVGPAIKRQWAARRDGQLDVANMTEQEFEDADFMLDDGVDIVIYPPGLIGELVSRSQIAEIPQGIWSDTEYFNSKELLRHARTTNVRTGRATWAVPLGSSQPVLLYRSDVLSALNSEVPETWEELDSLIQELQGTQTLTDPSGSALPTAVGFPLKEGWAGRLFLIRVASSVRGRGKLSVLFDRKNMDPLIETPPFVEALTQLRLDVGDDDASKWKTASEIYADMVHGGLALAISWPSAHFTNADGGAEDPDTNRDAVFDESKVIDAIQIARIPGSHRWYDGGDNGWSTRDKMDSPHVDVVGFDGFIASFNPNSGHSLTAHEFLKWLPSKAISLTTMTEAARSGPFRASHLGNPVRWTGAAISPRTAQQYGDVIKQINNENIVFVFPRIPGRTRYLRALNRSVEQCLNGELGPEAALKETAKQWRNITEQLNSNVQRGNLRRDEGI